MRTEYIDMIEIDRRIENGIYDTAEYDKAISWAREHLTIGENRNLPANTRTQEEYDRQFEYSIKMVLVARDLMEGNPRLAELASSRRPAATTPSPRASRASASGRTTSPTVTSWRPS